MKGLSCSCALIGATQNPASCSSAWPGIKEPTPHIKDLMMSVMPQLEHWSAVARAFCASLHAMKIELSAASVQGFWTAPPLYVCLSNEPR